MKIAIAYCRANGGNTIEAQKKIDNQIKSITNYAFKKNINIKSIFINNGLINSSRAFVEKELLNLLKYIRKFPEIDCLIITSHDRLIRDHFAIKKFVMALDKLGVKLISTQGEDYINSFMLLNAIDCSSQKFRKHEKS